MRGVVAGRGCARHAILLAASLISYAAAASPPPTHEIAVTFDDLPVASARRDPIERQERITRTLVAALRKSRIPVTAFVNGDKLLANPAADPAAAPDPRRVALLSAWLDAGFELGNHTFSHRSLHDSRFSPEEYERDIVRGEDVLRAVVEARGKRLRDFRHPYLQAGRTPEVRERIERFLRERGYRVAPVTIDTSDWIFALAFDRTPEANAGERRRIVARYLDYMTAKAAYYAVQSRRLFGREISQVLLVHANALNAEAFATLVSRLREKGTRFVSLDRALEDEAYRLPDEYFGPAGISWLDRWALARKVPAGFFSGEPKTPAFILRMADVESE